MSSPIKKEVSVKLEPDSRPIGNRAPANGADASSKSAAGSNGSRGNSNLNAVGSSGGNTSSRSETPKSSASSNSSSALSGWQDIPLKACTKEEVDDVRFHIMKFQSTRDVDIMGDFKRPVRLHRKDPHNIQFQLTRAQIDQRKREQEAAKLEKERLRAQGVEVEDDEEENPENMGMDVDDPNKKWGQMDLTQVAPDGGARKARRSLFKRKTRQVSSMDEKKRKLRYEEHYPWVIEDYEGSNVFVGNYEAGSSDTQHVLFVFDKDGFKMVPAEKVYRFTPRNKYATLTLEEAEAKMEKKSAVPRWLMKHMEEGSENDVRYKNHPGRIATPGKPAAPLKSKPGLRTVLGGNSSQDRDSDHDDLDFDEEFADDEEAPIVEGDEDENKMSEKKMKKDMLKAAHLFEGLGLLEDDDDLDDLFETETRKVDKEGKKLRKVLNKTEGGVYDSDDDDDKLNPYLSRSDLESDDDSDQDQMVKKEDEGVPGQSDVRSIVASNVGDGFVVIRASPSFLKGFPRGEWTTNGRKRGMGAISSPRKKAKIEEAKSPLKLKLKTEGRSKSPSPTPVSSPSPPNGIDLNSAGPDNSLVTINEVLNIVRDNPLTTKELLLSLRLRVSAHPDNKMRIISIVKQNLRLVDGKLVLKE